MKVKVENHYIKDHKLFISGYVGKKINSFNDVEVPTYGTGGLIDFIKETDEEYMMNFVTQEETDIEEEPYGIPVFDSDKMLEEIDYELLQEYIVESGILNG